MRTIHVIGDSISIHYGQYLKQYLIGVAEYSRKEGEVSSLDDPMGGNGGDSSMVLEYLETCAQQKAHWDYTLLSIAGLSCINEIRSL